MGDSLSGRISPNAKIGNNVSIGNDTIIYGDVEIGNNVSIEDGCIIGESASRYDVNGLVLLTKIGNDSMIRSKSIIYNDVIVGDEFLTGHRVTIREGMRIGKNCSVGTLCDLQGNSVFGDFVRLHSNVHIGQKSTLGSFVFIYPYVVLTNDPTPPSNTCIGPTVGNFSQIATMSVILPAVKIASHALVGAGSVISRDIDDYELWAGNPAKRLKDVRDIRSREKSGSHYPWPYNFTRGMPWSEIGFDAWLEQHPEFN
jgi:acetyltransferase-like isoleucine patch superfamily enzyme